jgi:predicted nucleotidyltransferase
MKKENEIIQTVLRRYPEVQAIYLFGGYGSPDERPESDLDLALLLNPEAAKAAASLAAGDLRLDLESLLERETDLINLRRVNTVFQHEIIQTGRVIYQQSEFEVDSFEAQVMTLYQKLNEERSEILREILESGRVLPP